MQYAKATLFIDGQIQYWPYGMDMGEIAREQARRYFAAYGEILLQTAINGRCRPYGRST